jgi:hypothetical protein
VTPVGVPCGDHRRQGPSPPAAARCGDKRQPINAPSRSHSSTSLTSPAVIPRIPPLLQYLGHVHVTSSAAVPAYIFKGADCFQNRHIYIRYCLSASLPFVPYSAVKRSLSIAPASSLQCHQTSSSFVFFAIQYEQSCLPKAQVMLFLKRSCKD